MEGKEEDLRLGANKFNERQPIGTAAYSQDKDYKEPPPTLLFEPAELSSWSIYQARIAEFVATFLYLYITVLTVMGVSKSPSKRASVGTRNSRHRLGFWWHDRRPCILPASQFNRDKQRPCNFLLAFLLKLLRESCHRNQMGTSSPF